MLLELKTKKIIENTIEEIVCKVKDLLSRIMRSTALFIENNEDFLNQVYEYAYNIIKYELIYCGNSTLLDYVKTDIVHTTYVVKFIKEEIEELSKKKQVQEQLITVNKNGFDDLYYLNKELLLFIIKSDKKEYQSIMEERIEVTYKKYKEVKQELEETKESTLLHITNIKNTKKKKNQLLRQQLARKALFFLNLSIVGVGIFGSIKATNKIPPIKEYRTVQTIYDSSHPENKEEEITYQKELNNELSIIEYSLWESPGYFRDEYQRNVYEYELDNEGLYCEDVEEYLTKDLKSHIILRDSNIETCSEPPEEMYTENKYVISQIFQNQDEYKEIENKTSKYFVGTILIACTILVDAVLVLIYLNERKDIKKEKEEVKNELMCQKKLLLEEKNRINSLIDQINDFKMKLNQQYEKLPKVLQEDEEIQRKIRKLNENE